MSQKTRFFGLYSTANGPISITATYLAEATEFSEITQNNGYYNAVQGHSRSSISVPIEKPHVNSSNLYVLYCTVSEIWSNFRCRQEGCVYLAHLLDLEVNP